MDPRPHKRPGAGSPEAEQTATQADSTTLPWCCSPDLVPFGSPADVVGAGFAARKHRVLARHAGNVLICSGDWRTHHRQGRAPYGQLFCNLLVRSGLRRYRTCARSNSRVDCCLSAVFLCKFCELIRSAVKRRYDNNTVLRCYSCYWCWYFGRIRCVVEFFFHPSAPLSVASWARISHH